MLYSTFTAFLGFAVNEGEYKVMGSPSYGTPRSSTPCSKIIRRTADGAFALDMAYLRLTTRPRRAPTRRGSSTSSGRRALPSSRSTSTTPRAGATPTSPRACSACSRTSSSTSRARSTRRPDCADLCLGGGVALNGCANARILARVRLRAPLRARRRRATRAARSARRSMPIASISAARSAIPRPSVLGADGRCRRSRPRRPRRRPGARDRR